MFVKNYNILFYFMLLQVVFGVPDFEPIDDDYYFNSALRTSTLTCKNRIQQLYCQIKCGLRAAFCIQDECQCLTLTRPASNVGSPHQIDVLPQQASHENANYVDSDEIHMISFATPESDASVYANRPTLRHHIAHFCPNLDVARECIQKCMAVGKPAFCGKDHVCYCGHSYSNNDNNKAIDVKEKYGEFKDLYSKYFGQDKDTVELDT